MANDTVSITPTAEAEEECVQVKIYLTTEWRRNFEEIDIRVIPGRSTEANPRKMSEDDVRDFSADRFSPGIDASDILRQIQHRGFSSLRIYIEEYPTFALLVIECWRHGLTEMNGILWSYIQRFLDTSFEQAFVRMLKNREIITLGHRRDRARTPDFHFTFNRASRAWKLVGKKSTHDGVQACA